MGFRGIVDDGGNTRGKVMVPTGFASSAHEMTLLNVPESAVADLTSCAAMPTARGVYS